MSRYGKEIHAFVAEHVNGAYLSDLVALVNETFGTDFTEQKMAAYKKNHHLKSGTNGVRPWTPSKQFPEEIKDFIRSHYVGVGAKEMAERLNAEFGTNYTRDQIKSYYCNHKLKSGVTGYFEKGCVPPNKGKKITAHPNTIPTQFKKGATPHNILPVGSEKERDGGYLWVKIAEPNQWRMKHLLIWEAVHGPKPKGHVILFGDRNKRNFDLSNLILIKQSQLSIMNVKGLIKDDVSLTRTGILIADVIAKTSAIKKKSKK